MERTYCGYPEWVKDDYAEQEWLLLNLKNKGATSLTHFQDDKDLVHLEIQRLLDILVCEGTICIEQLAILTKIRQILANETIRADTSKLLSQTSILPIIDQILAMQTDDVSPDNLLKYLQLESVWILINLSYDGSRTDMEYILNPNFNIL